MPFTLVHRKKTVHKKEVDLTKMIILMLVCLETITLSNEFCYCTPGLQVLCGLELNSFFVPLHVDDKFTMINVFVCSRLRWSCSVHLVPEAHYICLQWEETLIGAFLFVRMPLNTGSQHYILRNFSFKVSCPTCWLYW